jgi:hypothetical protein
MRITRRQLRQLITEVLNEEAQQSYFNLMAEVRDKFINDHLIRYFQEKYPDKEINTADDIRVAPVGGYKEPKGYSTSRIWGEYAWNEKALEYSRKRIGEDDIPVIWFARADQQSSFYDTIFGNSALDAILKSMNGGTMKDSPYILARTQTFPNDPYSEFHGADDKAVTVVYMKKI